MLQDGDASIVLHHEMHENRPPNNEAGCDENLSSVGGSGAHKAPNGENTSCPGLFDCFVRIRLYWLFLKNTVYDFIHIYS